MFTAGLTNTAMLYLVNKAKDLGTQAYSIGIFAAVFAVYAISQRTVQKMLIQVSEKSVQDTRTNLIKNIILCKYQVIAETGEERIITSLTTDTSAISRSGPMILSSCVSFITICSCLVYLAWLSLQGLLIVLLFITTGVSLYLFISKKAMSHLRRARDTEDKFMMHVKDLSLGSKELKLNWHRRADFFWNDISRVCTDVEENNRTAKVSYLDAGLFGNGVFYMLIAVVAFLFVPSFGVDNAERGGFLIVLLFLLSPISMLVSNLPVINTAAISANRLKSLINFIATQRELSCRIVETKQDEVFPKNWREIQFNNVAYCYDNGGGSSFNLGPLELCIRRGETLFVVGGNGSGKSTLGMLLTGLFIPRSGQISVDGVAVTEVNRDQYRQLFSAVFSNYHLFSRLYGIDAAKIGNSEAILSQLRIDQKVDLSQYEYDVKKLSQGERKRLALASCYLEGRSIYFFDEWAADQDPVFKNFFYTKLIAQLRESGNTVVAITHDDQYFNLADKVMRLQDGKLILWDDTKRRYWQTI